MDSNEWKLPLNLAIGFHVLIVLSSIYLPGFFKAKPKFAEIYTVSIINVAEPVITPPPPPPAPKVKQPKAVVKNPVKVVKAKKIAPIAEPVPTTSKAPTKAISLKPLKRKVVKKKLKPKIVTQPKAKPKAKAKPKKDYLAKKRRQELADALREEELLTERARLAEEAVEMEKSLLQPRKSTTPIVTSSSNSTRPSNRKGTGNNSSASQVASIYYAKITNRLLQFWALPESMQKQAHLMSTAVITINKNGQIVDILMENKSGDRVFDQFVTRTIKAANPMPTIPAAMRKQRIEIGLNFKPGGIQSN